MEFRAPPASAAWRHGGARCGFEVVFIDTTTMGYRLRGHTSAVEDGQAWHVGYDIDLDPQWVTRGATVLGDSESGARSTRLTSDGRGHWQVDGRAAPHLDGCLDVDLEASAVTNAFAIHRLGLGMGAQSDAPAAFVRALDVDALRLEQIYARTADAGDGPRYDYSAPQFGFTATLTYDRSGLVLDYPGIATRLL
jgi:uncharacterized protein